MAPDVNIGGAGEKASHSMNFDNHRLIGYKYWFWCGVEQSGSSSGS